MSDPSEGLGHRLATDHLHVHEIGQRGRSSSQGSQQNSAIARIPSGRLAGVALLAAAVVVPLFRQQGTPSWKTVWAEDGSIYTQQTLLRGTINTLFEGYHGYLQLPPRLLVIPTPLFPLRYLAIYCVFAGTITAALLAWFVYHSAQGWVSSKVLRLALASFVVVAPTMGAESTANVTNTIWLFLAALPWALVSLEESRHDTVFRAIVVFLAATSSALSLLFAPLGIGWWIYRRSRSALAVLASFLAGVLVQVVVSLTTQPPAALHYKLASAVPELLKDISVRVFGVFLFGTNWESNLWHASWVGLVIVGPLIVITLLALLIPGAGRRAQVMGPTFVLLAMAVFSVSTWGRGLAVYLLLPGQPDDLGYLRFSTPAVMLLASAFAILIAPAGLSLQPVRRIAVAVMVVQVALLAVVCFRVNGRGQDSPWIGRVDQTALTHCIGKPPSKLVTIPNIVKGSNYFHGFPNGFFPVTVHCSNIR